MTLVIDASAVVDLLLRSDAGERVRQVLAGHAQNELVTVAHLDAEVFSGLARQHRAELLDADMVQQLLRRLASLAVIRMPITGELLDVAWTLRANIAARDALYVATTRALNARLLTTDERLSRAVPDLIADLG